MRTLVGYLEGGMNGVSVMESESIQNAPSSPLLQDKERGLWYSIIEDYRAQKKEISLYEALSGKVNLSHLHCSPRCFGHCCAKVSNTPCYVVIFII
jgi:hypothetical protein